MSNKLLFIDFETSGHDPDIHSPLQLGAVLVDNESLEIIKPFKTFIFPPKDEAFICEETALKVNGIDPYNMSEASLIQYDFLDKFFRTFPAGGYNLVAWNANFDIRILKKMCTKYKEFRSIYDCIDYHHVDIQSICAFLRFQQVIPESCVSFDSVLAFFEFEKRSSIHDGLEDAYRLFELYKKLRQDILVKYFRGGDGSKDYKEFVDSCVTKENYKDVLRKIF